MKLRFLAVLVSALLSGSEALAWSTSSSADTVDVTTKTVYRYDTTTKTDSTGQATSSCSLLEASLDRSTGDASTDCQVTLQSCDTASGTEASRDCVPLPVTFPSEGSYIPINSPKAYTRVKVDVSPAGGDTCRVDLRCTTVANTSYSSGAATPGGSDTYVQYNDGGALGGDSGLTFNETSNTLTIAGSLEVPTITLDILGAYGLEGGSGGGSYFITTNGDPSSNISLLVDDALATDSFVFKAATQTLTNKTLTDPNIGVAGVKLSGDGDGALTLLGLGNGNDEDLTINLDDTANTAVVSSSTGLTAIDLSGITIPGSDILTTAATGISATTADGAITELANEKADTADILTSSQVWRADAATSWTSGAVTASDGTFLNLSAVNASSTTEGLKLPQATSCASATAEGQTCWDTDNNMLFIGDGTTAIPAGMEVLTWSYYNTTSVTTTLFGSDDLLGLGSGSTLTRNTTQTIRYSENLIPLGATGAQAFVHKLQCNLAPIGSSSWDSGSDSLALTVVEMDAASATAMTAVGSAATLSGSVSITPNPFLSGNVITSTINAFTALTGAAHYIGINPVLTDANASVVGLLINCQLWLKRGI